MRAIITSRPFRAGAVVLGLAAAWMAGGAVIWMGA